MDASDPRPPSGPLPPPVFDTSPRAGTTGEFASSSDATTPGRGAATVPVPVLLPMTIFRFLAAVAFAGAFGLAGVQIYRVVDEQDRSGSLSWGSAVIGVVCVVAVLAWTFATVENAGRILAPAATQEPPHPWHAIALWAIPLAFAAPAVGVVVVLSSRWNTPTEGTTSSLPLLVAFGAVLITLLLLYAPLAYLATVVRKIGGQSTNLIEWAWVPLVIGVVGAAAIGGMRAYGVFEGNEDGLAPTWVVAILLLLPIVVVSAVGFNAARDVEETVKRVYNRRVGRSPALSVGRTLPSIFGSERPDRAVLSARGPIRLLPGADILRLALVTLLAGLALLSVIGAIVMFLFWREAADGTLLPSQRDRAWEVLDQLQIAEAYVRLSVLGVVMIWALVNVFNARMASGRRRNPVIAMVAWPVAIGGIWALADRVAESSDPEVVVGAFVLQALLLYLPLFLLERAATAVGARRSPFRIVYAMGVVMLVYAQGLGGLSSVGPAESIEFGRLAGYLALGALVQLLSTLAVTEASLTISTACEHEAEHHNLLIEQRRHLAARSDAVPAAVD